LAGEERAREEGAPAKVVIGSIADDRVGISARHMDINEARRLSAFDSDLAHALEVLSAKPARTDVQLSRWKGTNREYRYYRAERRFRQAQPELSGIILLDRISLEATRLTLLNISYLLLAGSAVLVMALLVFYVITRKLVLSPVKALERAAERVRQGNLFHRASITTGDEFEQLAETLNSMLIDLQGSQERLRSINAALNLKVTEVSRSNNELFQAAKVKGEFLANVSHELRTPLNSIIGFAELLGEVARQDAAESGTNSSIAKRQRYLDNIVNAGRDLLAMINSLLEMAKIEAGRIELVIERMNLRETCEGLLGLIDPLARKKFIDMRLEIPPDLPPLTTDVKKFQQIVFNFLSNAVKFTEAMERTGRQPQITLRAERLVGSEPGVLDRIRVSVIDNGRGISEEDLPRIFEKFVQVDGGHTREQSGTGLGLAICKQLAGVLQAELQVLSEIGRGSMFSVILPLSMEPPRSAPVEPELSAGWSGARAESESSTVAE
jgi:signal transduction histidine kinase